MYKMLNLSLKEMRLIAGNRNINGYKSMPKDKLLRIINSKKGRQKESSQIKKRRNQKESFIANKT